MTPFRVLDLGAHDGFVTHFIARKAKENGLALHIDGVEANKDGVRLFNERAKRDDIPGECKHGLVADAHKLFEPYSYDAVVAYELIEHVTDVELFLYGVEEMVKPGGRVYISTPNGTFGEGKNPHHLRVWTATELFDLLRRRGRVCDLLPGQDGVTVCSYKPVQNRQLEVGIYVGPGWEEWSPFDISTKGLGGSETAAVRLAEALAAEGPDSCRITVYGEVQPGAVGQVLYKPHAAFDPMDRRDLLIVSRIPEVYQREINATKSVLWLHDTDCGPRLTEEHMQYIDRVMCLSRWHHDHLLETYPWIGDKLYITRNGIEPSYFTEGTVERNPHRAIYTSSPDRGLDFLLEIWPAVRARVPDAELAYAYANVYNAVADKDPRIAQFRDHIRSLSDQPGVTNLGSLTQPGVAKEMRGSGVWLAPSYSTPGGQQFFETFCIGAVEAAAAGCHRVMAQWGALEERDESSYPLSRWIPDSEPGGPPQKRAFINAVVDAMTGDNENEPASVALEMDWEEVAADFLAAAFADDPLAADPLPPAARSAMLSAFGVMGGASAGYPAG